MSLFICQKCGCVENTALVCEKDGEGYPNIHLMEMLNNNQMLCSECNTGTWHGEFEKSEPTDLEKKYATLSEYNMCTYYDHPVSFELFKELIKTIRADYFYEKLLENKGVKMVYDGCDIYTEKEIQYKKVNKKLQIAGILGTMYTLFQNRYPSYSVKKEPQTSEEVDRLKELAQMKRDIKAAKKAGKRDLELEKRYKELK